MKDYSAVAGQLGVTHLMVISQTKNNVILRLGRFPDGPTLHFRINQYSLCRQVRLTQKRPFESPAACKLCNQLDKQIAFTIVYFNSYDSSIGCTE